MVFQKCANQMMDKGRYKGRQDITDHLTIIIFLTVKFELEGFAHKKYMRDYSFEKKKKQFIDKMLCGCMLLEVR